MNTIAANHPAASCHHPRLLPPLSATRVVTALVERWDAWRERREQRRALEALARLDAATLRDLGLEDEGAARALARAEAQADYASSAHRAVIAPW